MGGHVYEEPHVTHLGSDVEGRRVAETHSLSHTCSRPGREGTGAVGGAGWVGRV